MARSEGLSRQAEAAALRAVEQERDARRRQDLARAKAAARAGRRLLGPGMKADELRERLAGDLKAIERSMKQRPPKLRKA